MSKLFFFSSKLTIQEHLKAIQNEMERKIYEIKSFHENEKQEIMIKNYDYYLTTR